MRKTPINDTDNLLIFPQVVMSAMETVKRVNQVDSLRCPACKEVRKAYFVCVRGHHICAMCWSSMRCKRCPIAGCVYDHPPKDGYSVERKLRQLGYQFKCRWDGCEEHRTIDIILAHEDECSYKQDVPVQREYAVDGRRGD